MMKGVLTEELENACQESSSSICRHPFSNVERGTGGEVTALPLGHHAIAGAPDRVAPAMPDSRHFADFGLVNLDA